MQTILRAFDFLELGMLANLSLLRDPWRKRPWKAPKTAFLFSM
jgi:hypothetical protein